MDLMSKFFSTLHHFSPTDTPIRQNVVYVPYDQLSERWVLSRLQPDETTIIMLETRHKGTRRQYHKQKLAILLSNNRHFALEQAKRGIQVIYRCGKDDYGTMLSTIQQEFSIPEIQVMRPAERELRKELKPCIEAGWLKAIKHEGWLSTRQDLENTSTHAPWKMASFYQKMRKRTGVLMENNKPIGGKYSFDGENRLAWKGDPKYPPFQPLMQMRLPTRSVISLNLLFQMQWVNWIEHKFLQQKRMTSNFGNGQNESAWSTLDLRRCDAHRLEVFIPHSYLSPAQSPSSTAETSRSRH